MKITLRRVVWLVVMSASLAILASPLAAPSLALGISTASPQCGQPLCPDDQGIGLSYDADSHRCVFGGGGCDLNYQ